MSPEVKAGKMLEKYSVHVCDCGNTSVGFFDKLPEITKKNAKRLCLAVCDEMIIELADLPMIPYNERRNAFWREVKLVLENLE